MTIEQVRANKMYALLTAQQRRFIEFYFENDGDMDKSVRDTFGLDLHPNAIRAKSVKLINCTPVRQLMKMIDGKGIPTRQEVQEAAWELYLTTDSDAIKRDMIQASKSMLEEDDADKQPSESERQQVLKEILKHGTGE